MLVFLLLLLSANLVASFNPHAVKRFDWLWPDWPVNLFRDIRRYYFNTMINGVSRKCYWSGTAPACAGSCEGDHDTMDRKGKIEPNDPNFGDPCAGELKKALCCWKIKED
ncbi:hypothetical protein PENTCL1PPCAC_12106, partial [Pristionchus entomophagus]